MTVRRTDLFGNSKANFLLLCLYQGVSCASLPTYSLLTGVTVYLAWLVGRIAKHKKMCKAKGQMIFANMYFPYGLFTWSEVQNFLQNVQL